jgi:hypothetical protein
MSHFYYATQFVSLSIAQDVTRRTKMQFRKIRLGIALLLTAGCSLSKAAAQSLYTLPEGIQTRWASVRVAHPPFDLADLAGAEALVCR